MSNIVASPTKATLPANIRKELALYNLGAGPLPTSYIAWQKGLAQEERVRLEREFGLVVHAERTVPSGWLDGFQEVELIAETRSGQLLKLRWHDSNQGFMVASKHGGSAALFPKDLA
jgi:hypothetical protein